MAIYFSKIDSSRQITGVRKLKKWMEEVIQKEKKKCGEIAIALCSDSYITKANTQFLQHNYPTDIITFGYNEGNIINGDLLISTDTVATNAKKYNCSYQNELHRVIIHGVLHLIGYDDHCEKDIQQMRKMEAKALLLLEKY